MSPENEEHQYTFFSIPEGLDPQPQGDWWVFTVPGRSGETRVQVRALYGKAELSTTPPDKKGRSKPLLKFPGQTSGFLCVVGEDRPTDLEVTGTQVSYRAPDGQRVSFAFNPDPAGDCHGNREAQVSLDGTALDVASWDIYGGPFLQQTPGVVTLSDGRESFTIDFRGELPRYSKARQ